MLTNNTEVWMCEGTVQHIYIKLKNIYIKTTVHSNTWHFFGQMFCYIIHLELPCCKIRHLPIMIRKRADPIGMLQFSTTYINIS